MSTERLDAMENGRSTMQWTSLDAVSLRARQIVWEKCRRVWSYGQRYYTGQRKLVLQKEWKTRRWIWLDNNRTFWLWYGALVNIRRRADFWLEVIDTLIASLSIYLTLLVLVYIGVCLHASLYWRVVPLLSAYRCQETLQFALQSQSCFWNSPPIWWTRTALLGTHSTSLLRTRDRYFLKLLFLPAYGVEMDRASEKQTVIYFCGWRVQINIHFPLAVTRCPHQCLIHTNSDWVVLKACF